MKCPQCGSRNTGFTTVKKTKKDRLGNDRTYYGKKYFCYACNWGVS